MVRSYVTPNPFLRVLVIGLSFSTCLSWQAAVEAQDHSVKPSRRFTPRGASDTTEVASDLQFNVVTVDGVFYVFEAAPLSDEQVEPRRYLALWKDFARSSLFTYGRSLFTVEGVAEAVEALARDLGEDAASIASARSDLSIAWEQVRGQDIGEAGWTVATRNGVLRLIGHPVPADPTGAEIPDVEFACPPPESRLPPGEPRQPVDGRGPVRLINPVEIRRPVETPEDLLLRLEGWVACGGGGCNSCAGRNCNDGNPCTVDACHCGACQYWPNPQGCPDDGNPCTNDVCANGLCTHPPANGARCPDDGNECTDDICNNLVCTHPANQRPCSDDGDLCTDDYCQNGVCVHSSPLRCDDGNPCTWDYCTGNFVKPVCGYVPMTGPPCDDGIPCTINDHCVNGSCVGSPNCNDGDSCTDDFCNGSCQHIPKNCNDGNLCTVDLGCLPNQGCQYAPVDCDDGNPCTTDGPCSPSQGCQNEWPNCNDGDPCTEDWCDTQTGLCEHGPMDPEPLDTTCGACTVSMSLPAYIRVNDDDDNGNGIADNAELGPVVSEDDLVFATISNIAGCPAGSCAPASVDWHICEWGGNRHYKVFSSGNKSGPIDHVGPTAALPVGSGVYLEGFEPWECPAPLYFWFSYGDCCWDSPGEVSVVGVTSLAWEKGDPTNADLEADAPINGGVRIFPDKLSPGDNPDPPDLRRRISLVATVTPAIQGLPVYFKVFDVDDPFDQLNPSMPDVGLIDSTPTSGPDNRPSGEAPWSATDTTVVNEGVATARVTFTVSMQPGNNYRAGASFLGDAVNQATQTIADAVNPAHGNDGDWSGYHTPLLWSKMLTVWRKLHVEIDSMGPVDWSAANSETSNAQSGTVQAAPTFDAQTNRSVIDTVGLHNDFEQTDQHKVGRIDITGSGAFVTIATQYSVGDDKVTIINAPASIVNANGAAYTLWDDDRGSDPNGAPPFLMIGFDAPAVVLPKAPDTSLMGQVFKDAYVEVVPPDMQYYDWNTPFDRNVRNNSQAVSKGDFNRDLTSQAPFWAIHITSAFQGFVVKDADPDTEQAAPGLQYGLTIEQGAWPFSVHSSGSLVFLETIRDHGKANVAIMATLERYTVAHESGHQFLLRHEDDYGPPDGPAGDEDVPLIVEGPWRLESG